MPRLRQSLSDLCGFFSRFLVAGSRMQCTWQEKADRKVLLGKENKMDVKREGESRW